MKRTARRLDKAYGEALCVPVHMGSRIVLMSDCHRGTGEIIFRPTRTCTLQRCSITTAENLFILNWETAMNCGKTVTYRKLYGYTAISSG